MITLKSTQRTIPINKDWVITTTQQILNILEYADYDVGIWLTNDRTIRRYNKQYRHKDKATDILSFPFHPDLTAGERIQPASDDDKNLGDIIISCPYVQRAAAEFDVSFDHRMQVLLVHGICHLLGYDHILDADYEVMHTLESSIIKKLAE